MPQWQKGCLGSLPTSSPTESGNVYKKGLPELPPRKKGWVHNPPGKTFSRERCICKPSEMTARLALPEATTVVQNCTLAENNSPTGERNADTTDQSPI